MNFDIVKIPPRKICCGYSASVTPAYGSFTSHTLT